MLELDVGLQKFGHLRSLVGSRHFLGSLTVDLRLDGMTFRKGWRPVPGAECVLETGCFNAALFAWVVLKQQTRANLCRLRARSGTVSGVGRHVRGVFTPAGGASWLE